MTRVKNLIRFGTVSSVNTSRCACRVTFADRENLVSAELPILQAAGAKNKFYSLPDVGDEVCCLMMPNDESGGGFVLGSFYHDKAAPPTDNQDESMIRFGDGTTISYNRATHELTINVAGTIRINGRQVYIN